MNRNPISQEAKEEIEWCRRRSSFLKKKYEALPEEEQKRRAERLGRIFRETIIALPDPDQQTLGQYWKSQTVVVDGVTVKAPAVKLDRWFSVDSSAEGLPADAMVNFDGTLFTFEYGLLFAPEEVLTEVCAHELAHAFFHASGGFKRKQLVSENVTEAYKEEEHDEEQAVHDQLESWKIPTGFHPVWQAAVEKGQDDWKTVYKDLKKRLLLKSK